MPRFKVFWTEKHSVHIEAMDVADAADKALRKNRQADSCDWQTIDDVEEFSHEELEAERADKEEGQDERLTA